MVGHSGDTPLVVALKLFLSYENNKVISKIKISFYCFIYIAILASSWVLKCFISYNLMS